MSRLRRGRALALTTALLVGVLAACGSSATVPTGPRTPGAAIGQPVDFPESAAVGATRLMTGDGRALTLGSLAGKVVVLSDMMTLCQETCPIDTATVVAVARAVERAGLGDRVAFLSVTVDPERDDAHHLTAYRRLYGSPPTDWLTLTGPASGLATLWRSLGVYTQRVPDTGPPPRDWLTGRPLTYDIEHSDEVFFFDQHQHERFLLDGAPHLTPGSPVPQTLYRFMDSQGHHNITTPDGDAWTEAQALEVLSWLTGRHIAA